MSEVGDRSSVTEKWSSGRSMNDLIKAFLGGLGNKHIVTLPIGISVGKLLSLTSLR
jgi:hypothetical protein